MNLKGSSPATILFGLSRSDLTLSYCGLKNPRSAIPDAGPTAERPNDAWRRLRTSQRKFMRPHAEGWCAFGLAERAGTPPATGHTMPQTASGARRRAPLPPSSSSFFLSLSRPSPLFLSLPPSSHSLSLFPSPPSPSRALARALPPHTIPLLPLPSTKR